MATFFDDDRKACRKSFCISYYFCQVSWLLNVIFKSRGQLAESKYLILFRFNLYYLYTTFEVRNVGYWQPQAKTRGVATVFPRKRRRIDRCFIRRSLVRSWRRTDRGSSKSYLVCGNFLQRTVVKSKFFEVIGHRRGNEFLNGVPDATGAAHLARGNRQRLPIQTVPTPR